jgi:hypothetical protein
MVCGSTVAPILTIGSRWRKEVNFTPWTLYPSGKGKGKKVKQSHYRPGVAQRVPGIKVPRFHDNSTGWW